MSRLRAQGMTSRSSEDLSVPGSRKGVSVSADLDATTKVTMRPLSRDSSAKAA